MTDLVDRQPKLSIAQPRPLLRALVADDGNPNVADNRLLPFAGVVDNLGDGRLASAFGADGAGGLARSDRIGCPGVGLEEVGPMRSV